MFSIFGKIKTFIIGGLLFLLPVIYVLGTILGRKSAQTDRVTDANKAANDAANFYRRMAEHEGDLSINDRNGLVDRLREDGL